MKPRIPLTFLAARVLYRLIFNLVSTSTLRSLCTLAFHLGGTLHILVPGLVPPQVQVFTFLLVIPDGIYTVHSNKVGITAKWALQLSQRDVPSKEITVHCFCK